MTNYGACMKFLSLLPTTLFLFSSPVVWSEEVDYYDLIERDGLTYKKFSEQPFTGTVCCYWKGEVIKGKREGKWTRWYDNGGLQERANYRNGKRDGLRELYKPRGQLAVRGQMKNDKKIGKWEFYDKYGSPMTCREFDKNKVWNCEELD